MDANSLNVSELSDAELATLLRQHDAACGPIIRKYYWCLYPICLVLAFALDVCTRMGFQSYPRTLYTHPHPLLYT